VHMARVCMRVCVVCVCVSYVRVYVRERTGGRRICGFVVRVCDQYLQCTCKSALAEGVFVCAHGAGVYACLCSVCVCIICASVCERVPWW